MKFISIAFMLLASWSCFAQPSGVQSNLQVSNPEIEAFRAQARAIGQANMDKQRETFIPDLLTPKSDPQQERQRLEKLKAINAMRIVNGQPPLQ